jgi:hypothetical protein
MNTETQFEIFTLGFISTWISAFPMGFRRGNVADLSVISACDVLIWLGSAGSGAIGVAESEEIILWAKSNNNYTEV